jgi:hypothetical protein
MSVERFVIELNHLRQLAGAVDDTRHFARAPHTPARTGAVGVSRKCCEFNSHDIAPKGQARLFRTNAFNLIPQTKS